jgi:hypothetical protein
MFACKKDSVSLLSFDQIKLDQIIELENKLTEGNISAIGGQNPLKTGDIILFKTELGNYGKMQILSIADASSTNSLTFNLLVYLQDGTEKFPLTKYVLQASHGVNLDTASDILASTTDFELASPDDVFYTIQPKNGAKFFLYSH